MIKNVIDTDPRLAACEGLVLTLAREVAGRWAYWRRHGAEADDLAQIGRMAVCEAALKFPALGGGEFAALAKCVAARRMADHMRTILQQHGNPAHRQKLGEPNRHQRHLSIVARVRGEDWNCDPLVDPSALPGRADRPVADHPEAEWVAAVRPLLARLTPRERRVLRLYYGRGWTATRVAAVMGVSESLVFVVLRRALHYLRERAAPALGGEAAVRHAVAG